MKLGRIAAVALSVIGLLALSTAPAQAADPVAQLTIDAAVDQAGEATITTTFSFAGTSPESFSQQLQTKLDLGSGYRQVYAISAIQASPGEVSVNQANGFLELTLRPGGAQEVTLTYTVAGATTANPDGTIRLAWNVLQGLSLPVTAISGRMTPPPGVIEYFCQAGVSGATMTCSTYSGGLHGSNAMNFTDGPRAAGDIVEIGATLEPGAVPITAQFETVWSLSRAFNLGWSRIATTTAIVVIGALALWGVYRRAAQRYARATPHLLAQLSPADDGSVRFQIDDSIRPGLVGTLIDQSVDPSDVLANLLDLAVRGHLRITELARSSAFAPRDWELSRRESSDALADYEVELLDALAAAGGTTRVSAITATVAPAIGQVQAAVYRQVLKQGWFTRLPQARSQWLPLAWAGVAGAVVGAGLLVGFTTWGLVGLALVAVALIGLFVAPEAPVVSTQGANVMAGLAQLSADLHNAPTALRPGHELADASRILPYAIVLGGWERWLSALVAADADEEADSTDLDWYHAPPDWHLHDLPLSLEAFITSVTGRLFTRA